MIQLDLNKEASNGISLDLKKESPKINRVKSLLNWTPHPVFVNSTSQGFDLDLWAFVLNSSGKIDDGSKVIYFNNKNYNNGAVVLPRDNRTGEGEDDEEINVDLSKLPSDAEVVIYVFLYDAQTRNQHFGMIGGTSIVISDMDTGTNLVKYDITKDFNGQTAIAVGKISASGVFTPIGDAGVMSPQEVLNFYS